MSQSTRIAPSASAPAGPERSSSRALSVRDLLFAPASTDSRAADLGLLLLRLISGLALAFGHGLGKVPPSERFIGRVAEMGFPAPELFAWLAATAEFGGGIFLALGLLTRPSALLIGGTMLIVTAMAHAGDPFGDRENAVLFGAIALMFLLTGPGRYSLDALIRRRN